MPESADHDGRHPRNERAREDISAAHLELKWRVARTAPRHETPAERHIAHREFNDFHPIYRPPRKWREGLKTVRDNPFFPDTLIRASRAEAACEWVKHRECRP